MKRLFIYIALLIPVFSTAQFVLDANFATLKFGGPGVTITNKVSDGTTAGSIILYQNVVNIGGQQVDAIIRTVSLSSGAAMIFDQAGTGTGYTNNSSTWFSPQFNFPNGGGNALFNFEFILGNTYNNATHTGTNVTLENIMINSYDIDGNGNPNSNQFSEFGGFFTSETSTATTTVTTYNAATNLTRYRSTIDTNVVDAADPNTRVRVTYPELNNFQISVGSQGAGAAFFFIDFDTGPPFNTTTNIITAPSLDLNTTTAGNNNTGTFCTSAVPFSAGGTNINSISSTPSGGTTLERLKLTIASSQLTNGVNEKLEITGATSGNIIALNFAHGAAISNIVLTGTTYTVAATVINGESSLVFSKNGSLTMTLAEGEKLLDAFSYNNVAGTPTAGNRIFKIRIKDGAYETMPYTFTLTVGTLPNITVQAQNAVIPAGSNASFTVTSNATSYQWQVDPATGTFSNISNSALYSGATTNQLNLTSVPFPMNNYQYRVVASSTTCPRTSNNAMLTVFAVLPVKWLNFTAAMQNKTVLLKWGTSSEQNSKDFIIQHSVDGIHFTNIGIISAAGTSNSNLYYNFIHSQPAKGNNFYRIQQVDNDGKSIYGKVITIINEEGSGTTLKVLSNPVSNGQISVRVTQPTSYSLYNAEGKLLKKQQLATGNHNINVSGYPAGMYTLLAGFEAKKILLNN